MNPYIYINNFRNEIPEPCPFMFALILSNQFGGRVMVNGEDFITKIKDKYYDIDGEIDSEEINLDEYSFLSNLSLFDTLEGYELTKWLFIHPFVENDLYSMNLN